MWIFDPSQSWPVWLVAAVLVLGLALFGRDQQ